MTCEYVRFFMCVKSNGENRSFYQLQEKKREKCV